MDTHARRLPASRYTAEAAGRRAGHRDIHPIWSLPTVDGGAVGEEAAIDEDAVAEDAVAEEAVGEEAVAEEAVGEEAVGEEA